MQLYIDLNFNHPTWVYYNWNNINCLGLDFIWHRFYVTFKVYHTN